MFFAWLFPTLCSNCQLCFADRSSFSDFAQKNGRDDRFKGIEKMRERESLFNEFIVEVRRREKDEKQHKKEQVSVRYGDRRRAIDSAHVSTLKAVGCCAES